MYTAGMVHQNTHTINTMTTQQQQQVVKILSQKVASSPYMDSIPYTLQRAAPSPPLKNAHFHGGTWTPIEYMVSWAQPSPQHKQHLDQVRRF